MMWRNKKLFTDEVDSNLPKKKKQCPRKKGEDLESNKAAIKAVWGVLTSVGQSNCEPPVPCAFNS